MKQRHSFKNVFHWGRTIKLNVTGWGHFRKFYIKYQTDALYHIHQVCNSEFPALGCVPESLGSLIKIQIPLILVIHESRICKSASLLPVFVTPKSFLVALLGSLVLMYREAKNGNYSIHTFPAEAERGHASSSL